MTQPLTVNQTFDTSLVDVQKSFSSTETNTSGSSGKENIPPTGTTPQREPSPFQTVSTEILYEQWASTYDTDGNVLQAVDDIQLHALLPAFVRLTAQNLHATQNKNSALQVLDLGCGTGRNTVKLLQSPWEIETDVTGWDGSRAMLAIARTKCEAALEGRESRIGIELEQVDIGSLENIPDRFSKYFDGLISTLVLEHIALDTYFSVAANVLKSGSYALITTMHPEMGALSSAGYKTASGERFKATAYAYTVPEMLAAAREAGFEMIGDVVEMAVSKEMIDGGIVNGVTIEKGQVAERARKWIGINIWNGVFLRKL